MYIYFYHHYQTSNNCTTIPYYIRKYVWHFLNFQCEINWRNALDYSQFDLSLPRTVRELLSVTSHLWMRESARLPGHLVRAAAVRQVRMFIQRAEARTRFARSSRMADEFGDLTLAPFRLLGKWQIRER